MNIKLNGGLWLLAIDEAYNQLFRAAAAFHGSQWTRRCDYLSPQMIKRVIPQETYLPDLIKSTIRLMLN